MRETWNEKPFEHICHYGTVFKADRHDFVGGVTAYVPEYLTPEEIMADAVELGAWHWANIVPQLNGFTGPGRYTIVPRTLGAEEYREGILRLQLLDFFTAERLSRFKGSDASITRILNCLKYELEDRPNYLPDKPITTVGQFLENCSATDLLRLPNLGRVSINLIVQALEEESLALRER